MLKRFTISAWVLGTALTLLPASVFARDRDDSRDYGSYDGDYREYSRDRHAQHEYREHERRERREHERGEWREQERRERREYRNYYRDPVRPGYYDQFGRWHPRY
jgi:hypothetical protein